LDVGRPECSGGFSSEHFWIDGQATAGRYESATRKRPCVPERGSSILVFFASGRSTHLSTDGIPRMSQNAQSNVVSLLSANQRLLEQLKAENERLGRHVAELMLEIEALREALGRPPSEIR
jgi:hypothetical protein